MFFHPEKNESRWPPVDDNPAKRILRIVLDLLEEGFLPILCWREHRIQFSEMLLRHFQEILLLIRFDCAHGERGTIRSTAENRIENPADSLAIHQCPSQSSHSFSAIQARHGFFYGTNQTVLIKIFDRTHTVYRPHIIEFSNDLPLNWGTEIA